MIRAVVVDDERLAREGIRQLSEDVDDLEVVAECASGREALERIPDLDPDLVFLDVQMPELDGFEVLSRIAPEISAQVIFITAYDQHALRAFEVNAADYLVKPVRPAEFHRAIGRVRSRLEGSASQAGAREREERREGRSPEEGGWVRRLLVRHGDRAFFVPTEEILWLASAANYVRLATEAGREYLIRGTLAELEEQLDPRRFLRVHRSTIINLEHTREVRRDDMHRYAAVTADGRSHRVSRSARRALLGHH